MSIATKINKLLLHIRTEETSINTILNEGNQVQRNAYTYFKNAKASKTALHVVVSQKDS